jgi:hypothetical protein
MKPASHQNLLRAGMFGAALLVAGLSVPAATAQPGAGQKKSLSSFKLITDRNIFSPNRTPSRPMTYQNTSTRTTSTRGESFSLVGTIEYEKGSFAFFDGTSSDYRKTLGMGGGIAGFNLTNISHSKVTLIQGSNAMEFKIGMLMKRDDNEEWYSSDPSDSSGGRRFAPRSGGRTPTSGRYSSGSRSSSGGGSVTNGEAHSPGGTEGDPAVIVVDGEQAVAIPEVETQPPAAENNSEPASTTSSGPENDVLRRLMQRREQEMNR